MINVLPHTAMTTIFTFESQETRNVHEAVKTVHTQHGELEGLEHYIHNKSKMSTPFCVPLSP